MSSPILSNPDVRASIDLLTAWIEARSFKADQPGLSVGIVYDQELIWARGFGYANIEKQIPATEKTLYRIASISKLFTATAIMQLRDAGKLDLDSPVQKYLPWFQIKQRFPNSPCLTVRNLLSHTSGLPREAAFPYWTDDYYFPEHQELVDALKDQETALPPYTKWKYSNLAVSLAGDIVAAVSGMPYEEYIEKHILLPLGMTNTYVKMEAPGPELLATGYNRRLPGQPRFAMPFIDCKAITPAANLATSVEDLARFAMLQMRQGPAGGNQILDTWTLAEMHRPVWVKEDWSGGWGIGFEIQRKNGKTRVGHSGGLQGFITNLSIALDDKIAAITLTNSNDSEAELCNDKIFAWVAPAICKAVAKETRPAPQNVEKILGKYRTRSSDSQVILYKRQVYLIDPAADDPMEEAALLVPDGENKFRVETTSGFGLHGEIVEFELKPDGSVWRMKEGFNYAYRVENW